MAKKKIFVMSSAAIEAACGAALDAIAARTAVKIEEVKIEESTAAATVDVQPAATHAPTQSPPEAAVKSRRRSG